MIDINLPTSLGLIVWSMAKNKIKVAYILIRGDYKCYDRLESELKSLQDKTL